MAAVETNKARVKERPSSLLSQTASCGVVTCEEEPCGAAQVNFSGLGHPNVCKLFVSISVTDMLTS